MFVLVGDRIVWRAIKTGISNAGDSQVVSGLQAGDWVALPPQQKSLKADMVVSPVLRSRLVWQLSGWCCPGPDALTPVVSSFTVGKWLLSDFNLHA